MTNKIIELKQTEITEISGGLTNAQIAWKALQLTIIVGYIIYKASTK